MIGLASLILEEAGSRVTRNRHTLTGDVVPESKEDLNLSDFEILPGTTVLRAELYAPGTESKGFSSVGRGSETRNLLFIDPSQNAANWLLPDNQHVITNKSDITDEKDQTTKHLVATVLLVEQRGQDDQSTGELLLLNPDGRKTTKIADDVSDLRLANLNRDELIILYERAGHFVLTAFDPLSLTKKREQSVEIPQLK